MGVMDMNRWERLRRRDASISTRELGRKEYISYLISKIVNRYQSLYIIRLCHFGICYWKLWIFS